MLLWSVVYKCERVKYLFGKFWYRMLPAKGLSMRVNFAEYWYFCEIKGFEDHNVYMVVYIFNNVAFFRMTDFNVLHIVIILKI